MNKIIAADLETCLIGASNVAPRPVVLTHTCEDGTIMVKHEHISGAIKNLLSTGNTLVFHNAKFDMGVLWTHYPELRECIFKAYKEGRIKCTMIREKLLELSTSGSLTGVDFSLSGCFERYFDEDISHWKKGGDVWRLRYDELMDVPLAEWPEAAEEYCRLDVEWCLRVYNKQESLRNKEGVGSIGTESLQTTSDFVLSLMTLRGMKVDPKQVAKIKELVTNGLAAPEQILKEHGRDVTRQLKKGPKTEFKTFGWDNKGKFSVRKKLIQEYVEEKYPGQGTRSKKTDALSIGKEGLEALPKDPILDCLREMSEYSKIATTYVPALESAVNNGGIMHANYDVLKETGRTSSFGSKLYPSCNIQNLPRKGGVREAFVARPGYVLVAIDYDSMELRSLAQVNYDLFGFSEMRNSLNKGDDPHCAMGAQILSFKEGHSIDYDAFMKRMKEGDSLCKEYRQSAKIANFGIPGGMGNNKLTVFARNYGVDNMGIDEAKELRDNFFTTFPEMEKFFEWHRTMQDSLGYYHYDTNGRWRANCTYCAASNGINLQSLSADGAKLAMNKLFEACFLQVLKDCHLVAFIHDENIFEMPDDENLEGNVNIAMRLMIEGVQPIMPDVAIGVEAGVMKRWVKSGDEIIKTYNLVLPPKNKEE